MQEHGDNGESRPSWLRRHGMTLLLSLGFVLGLAIMAYPTFADWWNQYHQTRVIAGYTQEVQDMTPEERAAYLQEAWDYNRNLAQTGARWNMTDEERAVYEDTLDFSSKGVMGYITIGKIGVQLPVYHGVDEAVLQTSIGHLEATSLPVGCQSFDPSTGTVTDPSEGSHCSVSGHRGLPSAKLFSDLDELVEGDVFTLTVLDQTFTYRIDQIRIVEPTDLSDIQIEAGKDYVTLVTCTPYGINTHRLLVRGYRIDNIDGADGIAAEAVQIPRYIAIPAVGLPMLFVFLIGALVYYRTRPPEMDWEQAERLLRDSLRLGK